jgi:hypothetical protein
VKLETCSAQGDDAKIMNRWNVEPVEYIDLSYKIPYDSSEKFLADQYSASIIQIRKFMIQLSKFNQCMERAQKIRLLINQILARMTRYGQIMTDISNQVV